MRQTVTDEERQQEIEDTYVRLMLACNDHRGHLEGLVAVELLRADGNGAIEFDGDLMAGENVQFAKEPRMLRLMLVASGVLHNGQKGSKEFTAKLHDLRYNVGNMCWNQIELKLMDAVRFLNTLLSFKHWNVSLAPTAMLEPIQEARWISPEQVMEAIR